MNTIPQAWIRTQLGEISDYGNVERAEPNEIPSEAWVLELADIEKNTSKLLRRLTFAQRSSKSTKNKFAIGDILYGKLRPYLNKVLIADRDGFCSTEIIPIKPNDAFIGRYLFYWLKHPAFLDYVNSVSYGLNMPRLGTKVGLAAPVILAPYNEQKRIAEKLDTLLERIQDCQDHLACVPLILERFRQSVLAEAVSGRLTEEWREEKGLSLNDWEIERGEDVFPFTTSGSRGWAKYYSETGAKFIRVGNLDHNTIELDLDKIQHVNPPNNAEGKRTRIDVGDILISITADIGMVGLVRKDIGEAYINQHICLARPTGEHIGEYLGYFLASPNGGIKQLTDAQRGMTKTGLTLGNVRNVEFRIPIRDEQLEIVHRVEKLFVYADWLETRYQAGKDCIELLAPSLLAKAFRGELVAQDPNDEPASVLLEHIQMEREAQAKEQKKISKPRKPRRTKISEESVKKVIIELPTDKFSFKDLSEKLPGDYERLNKIIFNLLSEDDPLITQVFDQSVKAMRFVRREK